MQTRTMAVGLVLLAAGCGGDGGLSGELADGFPAADSVVGGEAAAAISGGRFRVGDAGERLTLRFMRGSETVATMALAGLPAEGKLALRGIRVDPATSRAFPDRVEGAELVEVNGVRIGGGAPGDLEESAGVVLAASEEGDALLFRTALGGPDLRVRVDSATEITARDGSPLPDWRSEAGDSLRIAARARDGLLLATRIVVPVDAEEEETARAEDQPLGEPSVAASRGPLLRAGSPAVREGRGRGNGRGKGKGKRRG